MKTITNRLISSYIIIFTYYLGCNQNLHSILLLLNIFKKKQSLDKKINTEDFKNRRIEKKSPNKVNKLI